MLVAKFDQTEGTIFADKVLLSIYVLFTGVNFYDTLHRVKDQCLGEKASPFVWVGTRIMIISKMIGAYTK